MFLAMATLHRLVALENICVIAVLSNVVKCNAYQGKVIFFDSLKCEQNVV